ncbi:MAG: hypothetical protein ACJ708_12710 [Nitrososphaeraceae archaeon]
MAAISLAILVYIAVVITGTYTTQNILPSGSTNSSLAEQRKLDSAMSQQIASSLDYVHKSDINIAPLTVPLHGVNLSANQFILLYDSTPYASKGHIALNLPCDANTPNVPIFQVLVGRAPDLTPLALGYISQISVVPQMCIYHGQFGFGEPITDIVLKNISGKTISLGGPHSAAISTHEFYTPTTQSLEQIQHQQQK